MPQPKRKPCQVKVSAYTPLATDNTLKCALLDWRDKTARARWSSNDFGPDVLMHINIVSRIVDLAHARKLANVDKLKEQVPWSFAHEYGADIMAIISLHTPAPESSPFISTPLQSRACTTVPLASTPTPHARKPRPSSSWTCGTCKELGHRSMYHVHYV